MINIRFIIILYLSNFVLSNFQLRVGLEKYENTRSMLFDKNSGTFRYCDSVSDLCDIRFTTRIFIDSNSEPLTHESDIYQQSFNFNPAIQITKSMPSYQKKSLKIEVTVEDWDPPGNKELIGVLEHTFNNVLGFQNDSQMVSSDQPYHQLQLSARVYCDENYYGSGCDIYCKPTKNYHCKDDGSKECNYGWSTPGSGCTISDTSPDPYCSTSTCSDYFNQCDCYKYHIADNCDCDSKCEFGRECKMKNGLPECICKSNFRGQHCEAYSGPTLATPGKKPEDIAAIAVLVIVLIAAGAVTVFGIIWKKKRESCLQCLGRNRKPEAPDDPTNENSNTDDTKINDESDNSERHSTIDFSEDLEYEPQEGAISRTPDMYDEPEANMQMISFDSREFS